MMGIDEAIYPAWCVYGASICTPAVAIGQWAVLTFIFVFWLASNFRPCIFKEGLVNEAVTERYEMSNHEAVWMVIVQTCCNSSWMPLIFFLAGPLKVLPYSDVHGEVPAMIMICGAVLSVLCMVGFLAVQVSLGSNWSAPYVTGPVILEDHTLTRTGVYCYARHPLTLVILWFSLAIALATFNWVLVVVWLPFVALCLARIPREERMLVDQFGEDYLEYRRRVPALGPLGCCITCFDGEVSTPLLSGGRPESPFSDECRPSM